MIERRCQSEKAKFANLPEGLYNRACAGDDDIPGAVDTGMRGVTMMKNFSRCILLILTILLFAVIYSQAEGTEWTCPGCGRVNTSRFCTYCGRAKPEQIVCPACGWTSPDDPEILFCGDCGTRLREGPDSGSTEPVAEAPEKPAPPEANPVPAYYEERQEISLYSNQGFDIYYTFDPEAELPSGGVLFSDPILIDEGTFTLRAVCMDGDLVSDEMKSVYQVTLPKPKMPQATLAPNTYKTRQTVRLKPGRDNINDDDIVIYYTIDGSDPDFESPIYRGEPIVLPTGWVTLKAIAVNGYGKASGMLVVKYKIEANPKPKAAFTDEDMPEGIRPGTTGEAEFCLAYGDGQPADMPETDEYGTECRRYDYPWGYAVMNYNAKKDEWIVAEISYTENGVFVGLRGTRIGDTEEWICDQFKDAGQVPNDRGDRGLYENDIGNGKIRQEDDGRVIRYRYTAEGHQLQLEYYIRDDTVVRIDMKYIP